MARLGKPRTACSDQERSFIPLLGKRRRKNAINHRRV